MQFSDSVEVAQRPQSVWKEYFCFYKFTTSQTEQENQSNRLYHGKGVRILFWCLEGLSCGKPVALSAPVVASFVLIICVGLVKSLLESFFFLKKIVSVLNIMQLCVNVPLVASNFSFWLPVKAKWSHLNILSNNNILYIDSQDTSVTSQDRNEA